MTGDSRTVHVTGPSASDYAQASLFHAFQVAAARHGDRHAIRDADGDYSWTALGLTSRAAGQAMLALGLGHGDRIAIWAVNRARWIVAALGAQAVGATLVPIGTRLKGMEAADILRRARVRALFCDPGFGAHDFVASILQQDLPDLLDVVVFDGSSHGGKVLSWANFLAGAEQVEAAALDERIATIGPDDLADIIFTSGTTGAPKGVPMTHGQSLIACEQQQACVSKYVAGDVLAVTFPFAHNGGYRAGWQAALLFGVTVIPVRDLDPLAMLQTIEREKVTILPAVTTVHQSLLSHPNRKDHDLSTIRSAATGATTIPVALIEAMQAVYGEHAVQTGYGLTEAAGSVSNTRPGDSAVTIATTTGRPLDNLDVKLLDAGHRDVPRGQSGEVAIRGPQVMRAYVEDEAATSAAFTADGFLLTGDIGVFDADGNLRITDRIKNMYIVGGFNAYPAEIENRLRGLQGVADAAVIGVDDARLGQVGRAFIVREPGADLDEAGVIAWSREVMANYKAPRSVVFVDALPLNASGKVDRLALLER